VARLVRVGRDGTVRLPAEVVRAVGAGPGTPLSVEVDREGRTIALRVFSFGRPEMKLGRAISPDEVRETVAAGARA